jgi:uncharacterized protein
MKLAKRIAGLAIFLAALSVVASFALSFLITAGGDRTISIEIPEGMTSEVFLATTDDGIKIEGNYFAGSDSFPTMLLSHGIRNNRTQDFGKVLMLRRLGCPVIIYDIRAHGRSGGTYGSLGYLEALDIKAVMDWLGKRKPGALDKTANRAVDRAVDCAVVGWGYSLGAAACVNYQARFKGFEGLIVQGCFASVEGTTVRHSSTWYHFPKLVYPLVAMTAKIAKLRLGLAGVNYDPAYLAASIDCPTLLVAGSADIEAPPSDSEEIMKNLKGSKRLLILDGAGHQGMFKDPSFGAAVKDLVLSISKERKTSISRPR